MTPPRAESLLKLLAVGALDLDQIRRVMGGCPASVDAAFRYLRRQRLLTYNSTPSQRQWRTVDTSWPSLQNPVPRAPRNRTPSRPRSTSPEVSSWRASPLHSMTWGQ